MINHFLYKEKMHCSFLYVILLATSNAMTIYCLKSSKKFNMIQFVCRTYFFSSIDYYLFMHEYNHHQFASNVHVSIDRYASLCFIYIVNECILKTIENIVALRVQENKNCRHSMRQCLYAGHQWFSTISKISNSNPRMVRQVYFILQMSFFLSSIVYLLFAYKHMCHDICVLVLYFILCLWNVCWIIYTDWME